MLCDDVELRKKIEYAKVWNVKINAGKKQIGNGGMLSMFIYLRRQWGGGLLIATNLLI